MADLHSDLEEMECKNSHSSWMKLNICNSYYIEWIHLDAVMDARNMPLVPDQCFDLIIDKGLCL